MCIERLCGKVTETEIDKALLFESKMMQSIVEGESEQSLSIWTANQSLVVPKKVSNAKTFSFAAKTLKTRGWPVHTRNTGGDVTPQGQGIVNVSYAYTFDISSKPSIKDAYLELCKPIADFIRLLGGAPEFKSVPDSFCDGTYNVGVSGRKIAGTAQRWGQCKKEKNKAALFAHALILVDADLYSSTNAINDFYERCGRTDFVNPNAHLNLTDLSEHFPKEELTSELVSFLYREYRALLGRRASIEKSTVMPATV